jgi:hypothetical protein
MKAGTFNHQNYIDKLYEEAESNTTAGFTTGTEKDGILMPDNDVTKRQFDWLKSEYQKGKVEVKVEIKGEGSSFKPGYDLQTDLKSVKDFKPGMFGEVKTNDTAAKKDGPLPRGEEPPSPKNKSAAPPDSKSEKKDPEGGKEAADDQDKKGDTSPKAQTMKLDATKKKEDDK